MHAGEVALIVVGVCVVGVFCGGPVGFILWGAWCAYRKARGE
jgi:hypothetical protein